MYHTSNWISNPKGSVINKHKSGSAKTAQRKDETPVTVMKQHLVLPDVALQDALQFAPSAKYSCLRAKMRGLSAVNRQLLLLPKCT